MEPRYGRTPPCSAYDSVTLCSEYFHDVQITGLQPGTIYYYTIPGGNGTAPSPTLSFTTGRDAGDKTPFSIAMFADMGYTNAMGTHAQLIEAVDTGIAFAWHGGDISYADNWYGESSFTELEEIRGSSVGAEGIQPCRAPNVSSVCWNGTDLGVPPGDDTIYDQPLPPNEMPNNGGPNGGDLSTIYESNWDLWQNWMNPITMRVPYLVGPGNHEAACTEGDTVNNTLSGLLVDGKINETEAKSLLNYYSCPPSQRNFTAFQNRFRMPGEETGGSGNFWYSFDYGLGHFISFSGETDYYQSPELPFVTDLKPGETFPTENETTVTNSGPFGAINGNYTVNTNYEQYQWLKKDLESVDRTKTPWVIAMSHRPQYSSEVSSYQVHMRAAFEQLFLDNKVDAYMAG